MDWDGMTLAPGDLARQVIASLDYQGRTWAANSPAADVEGYVRDWISGQHARSVGETVAGHHVYGRPASEVHAQGNAWLDARARSGEVAQQVQAQLNPGGSYQANPQPSAAMLYHDPAHPDRPPEASRGLGLERNQRYAPEPQESEGPTLDEIAAMTNDEWGQFRANTVAAKFDPAHGDGGLTGIPQQRPGRVYYGDLRKAS